VDIVLRAAAVYVAVLLLLRLRGKRQLNQLEAFDLVLLLIISEATQQAMLGDDFSVTNGVLVVASLVMVDQLCELLKRHFAPMRRLTAGVPSLLIENGELLRDQMDSEGIDVDDILESARSSQVELDKIKYAILECNGKISIIPQS
jgi:uncharacterized membrane protein YcaP (DUF421 family)